MRQPRVQVCVRCSCRRPSSQPSAPRSQVPMKLYEEQLQQEANSNSSPSLQCQPTLRHKTAALAPPHLCAQQQSATQILWLHSLPVCGLPGRAACRSIWRWLLTRGSHRPCRARVRTIVAAAGRRRRVRSAHGALSAAVEIEVRNVLSPLPGPPGPCHVAPSIHKPAMGFLAARHATCPHPTAYTPRPPPADT